VAGGLLAAIDWRAVFWVNVPVGVFGTLWAYLRLKELGERHRSRMDWWGNPPGSDCSIQFGTGLTSAAPGSAQDLYHGEHEKRIGAADANWPDWYARYMVAEQAGTELPT
jgi:MFS family permease